MDGLSAEDINAVLTDHAIVNWENLKDGKLRCGARRCRHRYSLLDLNGVTVENAVRTHQAAVIAALIETKLKETAQRQS